MTANVMESDREKCTEAGMNDHVAKPIDPDQLFAALLRWIKPRRDANGASADTAAPPKTAAPAAQAADTDTPAIAGIDTRSALKRTGGNRKRYEGLLRKFAEQQAAAVQEIRAAMAAGDTATAQRAAHSLKGAAGNLGAGALAEAAAKAETALTTEQGVESALESLARSLDAAVEAIRTALPAEVSANGAGQASTDPATVVEPLTRLKKLLETDDGEAAEFIVDARPNLSGVLTGAEIESLIGLVGNFDFEAALKCLSGIAARLSLNLE
jgi:HPt (histidine-containing phosphotransfer) domain-containing protein